MVASNCINMNKLGFLLFFVAAAVIVISAEPVQYRARVRVAEKQQKPEADPESENVEVTTPKKGDSEKSGNQSEKQVEQGEEVEEPQANPETNTELEDKPNESSPYVPSGWKPAGNLLVLPVGGWVYVAPQPTATTTEAQTATTELPTESATTDFATTEPATTETLTTETATTDESSTDDVTTVESTPNEVPQTSADIKSAKTGIETTSEPNSESVDVEESSEPEQQVPQISEQEQPPSPQAPNTFFIQLSDGTFQRVIFLNPAANLQSVPVAANLQVQPIFQQQQLAVSPIVNPKIVTFTSQYQTW